VSLLRQQRQEIKDRLEALPYFDDITVVIEDQKDIANEIERGLGVLTEKGGKLGAVVILLTATAQVDSVGDFGPVFSNIQHVVRALEAPTMNRGADGTGKTSSDIIEQVIAALHHWTPAAATSPLVCAKQTYSVADDPDYPGHDARFECSGTLALVLPQVATPSISEDEGELTLACATAGAAIFYTTNGKRPNPRNGTLYTAPFTPDPGLTVKARAFLAGYLHSEIATHNS
jgi:hypothetical protein